MTSEFGATLAFGFLAAILLWTGWRRGFFAFPNKEWDVPIRFYHLVGAFAIYFLVSTGVSQFALFLLKNQIIGNFLTYSSWINFSLSFSVFVFLLIYWRFLPQRVRFGILVNPAEKQIWQEDIWNACYAWILSFPLVLFLSQGLELLIYKIFSVTQVPDQLAVKFLKSTFSNPLFFVLAVIAIIILAPLVEECLFRGFLQTYIRRHLGAKHAILITSVCFSLFHYAAGQGLGNISIIISLFVLSLFLGFIYEKQGSILSPMILHSLFNTVSVINLYLFGGFTTHV